MAHFWWVLGFMICNFSIFSDTSTKSRIQTVESEAAAGGEGGDKWKPPDDVKRMRVTIDNDRLVG